MTLEQRVAVLEEIFLKLQNYYMSMYSGEEIDALLASAGVPIGITKEYDSVSAMNSDFSGTDVTRGQFVLILPSDTSSEDYGKVYIKSTSNWVYVFTLTALTAIKGPQGPAGANGETGATGQPGKNFAVLGYYETLSALNAAVPSPEAGDTYGIGTEPPYAYYMYDPTISNWRYVGNLQGPAGSQGEKGDKGDKGDTGATGPQGPEGPVGGASNFVRYDAAQALTDAQKTQARENIAAAVAGGGVLETAPDVSASSASESYDTFCAKLDEILATMPNRSVKFLLVYPPQYYGLGTDICALYKNTNDCASVYTIGSYNDNRQGFRMIKYKLHSGDPAGQWGPLEYINPDMQLGVEYRTTERYFGKPVYVKAVNFGSLPNNSLKVVTFGDNTIKMISAHGIMDGGYVIPGCTGDSGYPAQEMQIFTADGGTVGIVTRKDRSNLEAVIVAKYWKTTD